MSSFVATSTRVETGRNDDLRIEFILKDGTWKGKLVFDCVALDARLEMWLTDSESELFVGLLRRNTMCKKQPLYSYRQITSKSRHVE